MALPRKKTAAKKKVAKKKVAARSKAITTKSQPTEIANLDEELARQVQEQSGAISPVQSNKIQPISSEQFKLPDGSVVDAPLRVVIVAFMARNIYYSTAYNPNAISSPDCAAQGFFSNDDLTPFDASELIEQQNPTCKGCWANEFHTALNGGAGKACQNRKEVAVLATYQDPDSGEVVDLTDDFMRFDVSPTGNGKFDSFVDRLNKRYRLPTCAFMVEAYPTPQGNGYTVVFKNESKLPAEFMRHAAGLVSAGKAMLDVKPILSGGDQGQQAAPPKKKAARRGRPARK